MNIIYGLRCIVNNKYYIGATSNFKRRQREHLYKLKKNKHHSAKLQHAWNKYNEDSFVFEIMEENVSIDDLFDREQYWMDYHSAFNEGYNGSRYASPCPIGERSGMFGKISHNKGKISNRRRPIVSYCLETGDTKHYAYVAEVIEKRDVIGPQFLGCITLEKIKKNGYSSMWNRFWFYEEDFNLDNLKSRFEIKNAPSPLLGQKYNVERRNNISKGRMGMKFSDEHRANLSKQKIGKGMRRVLRSDGQEFESVKDAALATGCDRTLISHNLSGKTKTCSGYKFTYL